MSAAKPAKEIANKPPTKKRGNPNWRKGGASPNPTGAPKRGESWQEIIKAYGDLTPSEAAKLSLELTKKLLSIGDGVTLKQAVVLRVYADLLYEPNPGLLNSFMERAEGKVSQPIELTWQAPFVELIRERKVTFAQVESELGKSLAVDLFAQAGVPVSEDA